MSITKPQLNAIAMAFTPALTLSLGYATAETYWKERRAPYQRWRERKPPAKQRWTTQA
jgi:hypothetical protein